MLDNGCMNMHNKKGNQNKLGFIMIVWLLSGAGLAAMIVGVTTLYSVPEIQSVWADSPNYLYDFDMKYFDRTFLHATAVGVIESESVKNDYHSVDGVDIVLVDNQYADVYSPKMELGKFFLEKDYNRMTAVINNKLAFQLFGYTDCVGEKLTYLNRTYDIVGVSSDRYTRYSEEKYRMFIPYPAAKNFSLDYVGVAGIPFYGNILSRQDLNRFMTARYKKYEIVDIVSYKQTFWFLIKLSAVPVLIMLLFITGTFLKTKLVKRIHIFKNQFQRCYLTEMLPKIIWWSILYAGIFFVVFYLLKMIYDQFLYDLLCLGQNFHITTLDPKSLLNLFYSIQSMTEKYIKPDELLLLRDSMTLITLSILLFYFSGLMYFVFRFLKSKEESSQPILIEKD